MRWSPALICFDFDEKSKRCGMSDDDRDLILARIRLNPLAAPIAYKDSIVQVRALDWAPIAHPQQMVTVFYIFQAGKSTSGQRTAHISLLTISDLRKAEAGVHLMDPEQYARLIEVALNALNHISAWFS